jgi:hypothetical protein
MHLKDEVLWRSRHVSIHHIGSSMTKLILIKLIISSCCATLFGACVARATEGTSEGSETLFGTTRAETVEDLHGDVATTLVRVEDGVVLGTATWNDADRVQTWTLGNRTFTNELDRKPMPFEQGLLLESGWMATLAGHEDLVARQMPIVSQMAITNGTAEKLVYTCSVDPDGPYCEVVDCIGGGFYCSTHICQDFGWGECIPFD